MSEGLSETKSKGKRKASFKIKMIVNSKSARSCFKNKVVSISDLKLNKSHKYQRRVDLSRRSKILPFNFFNKKENKNFILILKAEWHIWQICGFLISFLEKEIVFIFAQIFIFSNISLNFLQFLISNIYVEFEIINQKLIVNS